MTTPSGDPSLLDDFILPFQIDAFGVRGRLVRLGGTMQKSLAGHGYPMPVRELNGEAMALSAVLAGALKYDGLFTLQIQSDGPVSLIVVDVDSSGGMRSYARYDEEKVSKSAEGEGGIVPRMLGSGHLAFTVDQGANTDRYQGITELDGATLADCAHNYFHRSEQLETAIMLASSGDEHSPGAAALMIQRLPGAALTEDDKDTADEQWREAVILLSSMTAKELLDPALSAEQILFRLYHHEAVRIYKDTPLRFQCRCSEEKVSRTLASFPRQEIEDLKEDGQVEVICEFCRAIYRFSQDDLETLYTP
ncbi:MAG: Hsp33 family molecular chaperone HslO [Rhodospirillales bacterium]|nr:Hsp33 family molecular chaperone HslO [Rhodospirillales bacterium]